MSIKIALIFLPVILGIVIISSKRSSAPSPSPSPKVSPSPTPLPTPTPSPSPIPSPSPSPSLSPSPSPSPLPSPIPSPSPLPSIKPEEIHGFIDKFSREYNLDPGLLRHIAICESGFNPLAENLSYSGLFQFSPNTWTRYRNLLNQNPDSDLRLNAEASVQTAAYVLSVGNSYIWPNCMPE